jgi:hypothetical protein
MRGGALLFFLAVVESAIYVLVFEDEAMFAQGRNGHN